MTETLPLSLTEDAPPIKRRQPLADLAHRCGYGDSRAHCLRRRGFGCDSGRGRDRGRWWNCRRRCFSRSEVRSQRLVLLGEAFDVGGQSLDLGPVIVDLGRVGACVRSAFRFRRGIGVRELVLSRLEFVVELDTSSDGGIPLVQCEVALAGEEVGEIWIRSPQVMTGYWRMPEEAAKVVAADGWFKSGDAGYLDDDGYPYICDRVKDMIVSGGENVYPAEVENVLIKHGAIADFAVIGVLRRKPSGKIVKKGLREPYRAGKDRWFFDAGRSAPAGTT
ncbi:MAG: AMP-binding protein [Ilumatobacter sp.]|nr:AMP-binding protein [Ilumatobacter sp.]